MDFSYFEKSTQNLCLKNFWKLVATNVLGHLLSPPCFQYKDEKLEFFPHAEGYVSNVDINNMKHFNYVYQYKDHLGNIRLSYGLDPDTGEIEVLEENHYYPFGLKHANYSTGRQDYREENEEVVLRPGNPDPDADARLTYNYKYNGKEWQDELSLNWYDYGARNYDPAIGRWMNIDPLAEQYRRWSPYNYCVDNPMRFVDPDGMGVKDVTIIGDKKDVAFQQLQSSTNMKLTMHDDGRVTTNSKAETKEDQQLLDAINNPNVNVQVNAHDNNCTEWNNKPMVTDAFLGNSTSGGVKTADGSIDGGCTTAFMEVSVDAAQRWDDATGKPGIVALHATVEGNIGANTARERGDSFTAPASREETADPNSTYRVAHDAAPNQGGKMTISVSPTDFSRGKQIS